MQQIYLLQKVNRRYSKQKQDLHMVLTASEKSHDMKWVRKLERILHISILQVFRLLVNPLDDPCESPYQLQ